MSFKTTLMRRPQFTTEALEQAASDLRSKGRTTIRDPDGDEHEATVLNAEVTERGLEVEVNSVHSSKSPISLRSHAAFEFTLKFYFEPGTVRHAA